LEEIDGQNSLRRFRENPWPLDLVEVQGRYDVIFSKGYKLRRGRAIDPSHKDRQIYMRDRASGFRGWKSRAHSIRDRDIPIRDIPIDKGTVWDHKGQRSGQVARLIGVLW
jgi:hypothetical protein